VVNISNWLDGFMNHLRESMGKSKPKTKGVLRTGKREAHMSAYDQKTIGLCNFVYMSLKDEVPNLKENPN
jgi:hypothetical protein